MADIKIDNSVDVKLVKGGAKKQEMPCHKNPKKKPHCFHLVGLGFNGEFGYRHYICCWCGLGKKEKYKIHIPEITKSYQLSHGPYLGKV
jgi:hypothetical protein